MHPTDPVDDLLHDLFSGTPQPDTRTRRELILDTITDAVADLLYYDRKEDEELPTGAIEQAIATKEVSIDELVAHFRDALTQHVSR